MIEDSENDVLVSMFPTNDGIRDWAEIDVATWPDGSPKNDLNKEELKRVADMLYAMAEQMDTERENGG